MGPLDLTAFAPLEAPSTEGASVARDGDGLVIPPEWLPAKWARLPLSVRQGCSERYLARLEAERRAAEAKAARPERQGATRYSTQYARKWGESQGWKFVAAERVKRYQQGKKWMTRHEDLAGGSDVQMRAPDGTLVFIQGAGRSERAEHRRRFEERRGDLLDYANWRFFYVEFERGSTTPVRVEEWR